MPIQMGTADYNYDNSAHEVEISELLESTCREAITIMDRIRSDELADAGMRDAIQEEVRSIREAADREAAQAAHLQRFEDNGGKLSAADAKKKATHIAREKKLRAKANAKHEEAKKGRELYQSSKLAKWCGDMIALQRKEAVKLFEAARRAGTAGAEESAFDYTPRLIFKPRAVKTPDSESKLVAELAKYRDGRAMLMSTKRQKELASAPFDEVLARELARIRKLGTAPEVGSAFKMVRNFDGRRSPGEVRYPTRLKKGTADEFELDPLAILFWACGPQIEAAIMKLLKDNKPGEALSAQQRSADIMELDASLAEMEVTEAAITWRLMKAGHKVSFRHDMDPANVLGVSFEFGEPLNFG
jgi:hypothetical protein